MVGDVDAMPPLRLPPLLGGIRAMIPGSRDMISTPDLSAMPAIPVQDVRDGGPLRLAREGAAQARALRDDCVAFFPRGAGLLVSMLDAIGRRWLSRSRSPYVAEIGQIAAALGFPGVWFLNNAYNWGCTALVREEEGVPWLARTLDWPFPGLGRHVEVARMRGPAGEFFSATWPGYAGVLTAMAPGRFAAAVNQAPLWRRTRHPWLRPYDLLANGLRTWRLRFMPPDQLLRLAFESCGSFAEARRFLESEPVARPVIYSLAGCRPGERCVIERTEDGFTTHEQETCAANDWLIRKPNWEARIISTHLLTRTADEAAQRSRARSDALLNHTGSLAHDGFAWVAAPVLNPFTRIAAAMCPARGIMRIAGYEVVAEGALPEQVTQVCEVEALAA